MGKFTSTVQNQAPAAELLVLNVDNKLVFGMEGIKAGGSVTFDSRGGFGEEIFLKWKGEALFNPAVKLGRPNQIKKETMPGFYRFGYKDQAGFPFGIGVESCGRASGTYMVFEGEYNLLRLRVFSTIKEENRNILFKIDYPEQETSEIFEIKPDQGKILELDQNNQEAIREVKPNYIGSVIYRVESRQASPKQIGGGEEAEIEILPP